MNLNAVVCQLMSVVSTDCCRNDRLAHLSCRLWPPAVSAHDGVAGIPCERTPMIYEHIVRRVLSYAVVFLRICPYTSLLPASLELERRSEVCRCFGVA